MSMSTFRSLLPSVSKAPANQHTKAKFTATQLPSQGRTHSHQRMPRHNEDQRIHNPRHLRGGGRDQGSLREPQCPRHLLGSRDQGHRDGAAWQGRCFCSLPRERRPSAGFLPLRRGVRQSGGGTELRGTGGVGGGDRRPARDLTLHVVGEVSGPPHLYHAQLL